MNEVRLDAPIINLNTKYWKVNGDTYLTTTFNSQYINKSNGV